MKQSNQKGKSRNNLSGYTALGLTGHAFDPGNYLNSSGPVRDLNKQRAFPWSAVGVIKFVALIILCIMTSCYASKDEKPNVLLIAVDDLNDWIGSMGGHPQAKTPNVDRLAARGVLFTNAHCQSPVCNPSRASLMASLYPSTTGIYFLNPDLSESPVALKNKLMPQRFLEEGYYVTGAGKLFHNGGRQNEKYMPNYEGRFGGFGPRPDEKITSFPGIPLWDWGVYPEHDKQMPDYKIASWAEGILADKYDSPLWLGVGFYRPHVPQYAPQKWFDLYPIENTQLPETIENDLEDISPYGIDITRLKHVSPTFEWVVENNEWESLVQSYLACVSFVDHQVGRVLDALEKNPNFDYDNTYVVLFSDHGFHLGEKQRFAKRSLWEEATRVPMIIAGPGIAGGKICNKPVQLLDIYPTLLELTGLEADSLHEGHSMVPLLKDPESEWPYKARASFGPGNYAIISERYRYIHYNDGSEEFYDHVKDPNEWDNMIEDPELQGLIQQHREQLPLKPYDILGEGSTGHLSYEAAEANRIK
jgi:arylsulfatase A-like enzyme